MRESPLSSGERTKLAELAKRARKILLTENLHQVAFHDTPVLLVGATYPGAWLEHNQDALLLAKNVDAVYSADPRKVPDAKKYSHLTYKKVLADNLQATDLTAITLCREQNLPILVFALKEIGRVAAGEQVGTRIDSNEQ